MGAITSGRFGLLELPSLERRWSAPCARPVVIAPMGRANGSLQQVRGSYRGAIR